jgi:hypothetical protein
LLHSMNWVFSLLMMEFNMNFRATTIYNSRLPFNNVASNSHPDRQTTFLMLQF